MSATGHQRQRCRRSAGEEKKRNERKLIKGESRLWREKKKTGLRVRYAGSSKKKKGKKKEGKDRLTSEEEKVKA